MIAVAAVVGAAASMAAGPPSHTRAHAALEQARDLRAGHRGVTGRELTPALAQLYASLPALSASDRTQGEALLARPDDSQPDPSGTHKWSSGEDSHSPWCVPHFCIHWPTSGADAPAGTPDVNHNQVPDSLEQMADIFENEVYPCENGSAANACSLTPGAGGAAPGLAWREPESDGTLGGDARLDIYIEDLFPASVFGYAALDLGQPPDPAVPHHAYMVMDKDYSRFANGSASGGVADERVTAAHEYNHVLQFAYDYLQDGWMFESTAVWMEDKVYPGINDYLQYLPDWVANPAQPLTTFSKTNLKQYGSAVWNHWLDHRYGTATVRAAWEDSVPAANLAPASYDAAIRGASGAGFSDEFGRFVAATSEWDAPSSGFPDPYPDVARSGTLPAGNVTAPFPLAHTAFAFFDVPVAIGAPIIRLTATLPVGTAGGVALVGRTGSDPAAGSVTSNFAPIPSGGIGAVTLNDPSSFGRVTAVVVNSDFATAGFDPAAGDYIFTHDAPDVTAALDVPGPPFVTTGVPVAVADHSASVGGTVDPHLLDTTWRIEYGKTASYGKSTAQQPLAASVLTPANLVGALGDLDAQTTYHYRVVASNSEGEVLGNDATFTTAHDVTPPVLTLTARRRQKIRSARFAIKVSERVTGSAKLELPRRIARKLGLPRNLAVKKIALGALAKPTTIRLRVGKRARALKQGLSARLVVDVADASRNHRHAARSIVLSP